MPQKNIPLPRSIFIPSRTNRQEILNTDIAEQEGIAEKEFWTRLEARLEPVLPNKKLNGKLHIGWKLLLNAVVAGDAGLSQLSASYVRAAVNCYERRICLLRDDEFVQRARDLVDRGNYAEAIQWLERITTEHVDTDLPFRDAELWMYLPESSDATSDLLSKMEATSQEASRLLNQIRSYSDSMESIKSRFGEINEQSDALRNDASNLKKEVEDAIADAKANAIAGVALGRPVEFWMERSKSHLFWSKISLGIFLAACAAVIGMVVYFFGNVKALLQPPPNGTPGDYLAEYVFILITFGIPAFLALWILRVLHRIYATQQQLGNDARERETMMKTYLALAGGQHVSKDDLHLALRALFRPHTEMIVDDAPPTLVEAIAAQLRSAK